MDKKFIVLIIDGFGLHAMRDAATVRPGDEVSSTFGNILMDFPDLKLPNMEELGLMNAFGTESKQIKIFPNACYGCCELMHTGADTFMGHQEIMGIKPIKPLIQPFQEKILEVARQLRDWGHQVEFITSGNLSYILVDNCVTVADNIDADLGMAYNVTALLDYISFNDVLKIGLVKTDMSKGKDLGIRSTL